MSASPDKFYYRDKKAEKHTAVQQCAAKILEHKNNGEEGYPKGYNGGIIRAAINLLVFEGLLSRRNDFVLNDKGKRHIETNGFVLYPT